MPNRPTRLEMASPMSPFLAESRPLRFSSRVASSISCSFFIRSTEMMSIQSLAIDSGGQKVFTGVRVLDLAGQIGGDFGRIGIGGIGIADVLPYIGDVVGPWQSAG